MKNVILHKSFSTFLFLLLIFASLSAQNTTVSKGRVFLADGQIMNFTSFTIGDTLHAYQTSINGSSNTLTMSKVVKIEEQNGTEAGKWALWLGLSGLVGSALGIASAKNDADKIGADINGTPIILGLTGLSAGIGALIGAGKKKYKTVYTNAAYSTGFSDQQFKINLAITGKGAAFQLAYHF